MKTILAQYSYPAVDGRDIPIGAIITPAGIKDDLGREQMRILDWPRGGSVEIIPSTQNGLSYTECGVILIAPVDRLTADAWIFIVAVNEDRAAHIEFGQSSPLPPITAADGVVRMPIHWRRTVARIGSEWWKVPHHIWHECTFSHPMPGYDDGAFVLNLLGERFVQWTERRPRSETSPENGKLGGRPPKPRDGSDCTCGRADGTHAAPCPIYYRDYRAGVRGKPGRPPKTA